VTRGVAVALALLSCGPRPLVVERPYELIRPEKLDPFKPAPLVVLLHGYMDSGDGINRYFMLDDLVDGRGFLYTHPDGTTDSVGKKFWNATDACCNYQGSKVDDVAYLTAVLDDIVARNNVDPKRIYLVGHSNGGFMVNRLGCELSPRIAAVVSLAGANWFDPSKCKAASPVNVLQIHGDADDNVFIDGGTRLGIPYPSAQKTVRDWGTRNGCTGTLALAGKRLDADNELPGEETYVAAVGGCPDGGAAELWTVEGGAHKPDFPDSFPIALYQWLEDHPKP
jgi:polyhydroxybutyrate depolymerase